MQTLHVMCIATDDFLGLYNDINGSTDRVDHRGAGSADFGIDVVTANLAIGDGGHTGAGIEEADLPNWRSVNTACVISVEGICTVMFCDDEHQIVDAFVRHVDVG